MQLVCHGKNIINNPRFLLNHNELRNVDSRIHLDLPFGNQNHIESFFCENLERLKGVFIHLTH